LKQSMLALPSATSLIIYRIALLTLHM
jgi:hypothetical protein